MRPIDFRLNGVSAEWDGAPNASESVIKVNGSEVARNLATNPRCLRTNTFEYWPGMNGSVATQAYNLEVEWSQSGTALHYEWITKVDNSGNCGYSLSNGANLEAGKQYTVVQYIVSNRDGRILGEGSFPGDKTFSEPVEAKAGEVVQMWMTFTWPENAAGNLRLSTNISATGEGVWLEISDVDIYEGPYDPNRPWFSGDSTPEQLMQSPTIGSPLEGSLEDIAGPLVAELTSYGTVDAPLDPLSSRTLVCVTKDRSAMPAYYAFCNNGETAANGRIDLRTGGSTFTLATRFDAVDGSANATFTALNRGGNPIVLGVILKQDISNEKSFIRMFDSARSYNPRYVNFGNGITDQKLTKTDNAIWAGLWPKALTEDEIAKVTLWLKQRYL